LSFYNIIMIDSIIYTQLKAYIARTASKIAPELRRRPGQV
jgi:hypothetical protein